ncbi:hypothetical protein [Chryseobacterium shigense]|uniref:Uncharacterized protein n=1 Tax=Chryseobacterium shigense TaxID=297244 RepID=A0A841N4F9_9FLAO|nr:hypothetical protein [Chryseobacterium shigense]MBB6370013.1 hypothetical protein [Chryseobacterium shigense]
MIKITNYYLDQHIRIDNFDQLILWIAILTSIGTITTGAYLASFSKGFLYSIKTCENKYTFKKFSLAGLQLPFKKTYLKDILLGIDSKTSTVINKALKADSYFMPFAYGGLLMIFFYFWLRFMDRPYSFIYILLIKCWYFPLAAYAMDILENNFTVSLLEKLDILKQERITNPEDWRLNEDDKNKLISTFQIKIIIVSGLKWLTAILSILIILAALYVLLFP